MRRRARPRLPRPALTIRYPDGQAVHLHAGRPAVMMPGGSLATLTVDDLRAAGAHLVLYGLATRTGRHEVTARVSRPELLTAIAERATAGGSDT